MGHLFKGWMVNPGGKIDNRGFALRAQMSDTHSWLKVDHHKMILILPKHDISSKSYSHLKSVFNHTHNNSNDELKSFSLSVA